MWCHRMSEWSGLKKDEIRILIGKYSKILRSLRCEYNKRNNVYKIDIDLPNELQKTSLNVLGILSLNDDVMRTDVLKLLESFYKYYNWSISHGAYTNELLAVCIVTEVINHWNIKYDLDNLLEIFGLDRLSYNNLYYRIHQYADLNYWKS
jgi:hypothetical protein